MRAAVEVQNPQRRQCARVRVRSNTRAARRRAAWRQVEPAAGRQRQNIWQNESGAARLGGAQEGTPGAGAQVGRFNQKVVVACGTNQRTGARYVNGGSEKEVHAGTAENRVRQQEANPIAGRSHLQQKRCVWRGVAWRAVKSGAPRRVENRTAAAAGAAAVGNDL